MTNVPQDAEPPEDFLAFTECSPSPRTQCLALPLLLFVHHFVSFSLSP